MSKAKTIHNHAGSPFGVVSILFGTVLLLAFSGCFSPYKGSEGTLTLSLGGDRTTRAGWDIETDNADYEHTVILEGPGGTITQTFAKGTTTASFQLGAGKWNVTVRDMGARPQDGNNPDYPYSTSDFPDTMLKALGYADVEIKAGQITSAPVYMVTATEVFTADQLTTALGNTYNPASEGLDEYILIANDIVIDSLSSLSLLSGTVTLVADKDVHFTRGLDNSNYIFDVEGGQLILGRPGMKGKLFMDGRQSSGTAPPTSGPNPFVYVAQGASLVMNDNVFLIYNNCGSSGGAIYVYEGYFTMNGGTISNNTTTTTLGNGGAVYVDRGYFTMNGGTISNNTTTLGNGGAVYVYGDNVAVGTFNMVGGSITGNNAIGSSSYGGGVYVNQYGYFIMGNNAVVSGNTADNGGGVYVLSRGFTASGGKITGNTATSKGGGVYVDGAFLMAGNTVVSGNSAVVGGGVFVNSGNFYIAGGTVYGKGSSGNTAFGAALAKDPGFTSNYVQYGKYDVTDGWVWYDIDVSSTYLDAGITFFGTDTTISISNGQHDISLSDIPNAGL